MNTKLIKMNDFTEVDRYLEKKASENNKLVKLLKKLDNYGDVILIGGAIRDIILKKTNPRDLDLIIDTDQDLEPIMREFKNYKKNRFGGFKLEFDDIEIDLWSIENHWAFKNKILETKIDNLKYSTFLNFDSLWYNVTKKSKEYDIFNQCLKSNVIDITLEESNIQLNPTKAINIVRMLNIKNEWELEFSVKSKTYIKDWVKKNNNYLDELYKAQIRHYKMEKICRREIVEILELI